MSTNPVIVTDDVIASEKPCLQQMVEAFEKTQSNIVAVMDPSSAHVSRYGHLDMAENPGSLARARKLLTKPHSKSSISAFPAAGRYILKPQVLQKLARPEAYAGGAIDLIKALESVRQNGQDVYGLHFEGRRFDCGSKLGLLQATIAFALKRGDLKDELRTYLKTLLPENVNAA